MSSDGEAKRSVRSGHPPVGAVAVMAGFIAWLGTRHLPEEQEQTVLEEVEQFLRWHHAARPGRGTGLKRAAWQYLEELRRRGADDTEQRTAWAAVRLLITYDQTRRSEYGLGGEWG